jgi:hypothetical protein
MGINQPITAHQLTRKPFVSFCFCFVHFLLLLEMCEDWTPPFFLTRVEPVKTIKV